MRILDAHEQEQRLGAVVLQDAERLVDRPGGALPARVGQHAERHLMSVTERPRSIQGVRVGDAEIFQVAEEGTGQVLVDVAEAAPVVVEPVRGDGIVAQVPHAHVAARVSVLLQQVADGRRSVGQRAAVDSLARGGVVVEQPVRVRIGAGEPARPRRRAQWRGAPGVLEPRPARRQPVDVRGAHHAVPGVPCRIPAELVAHDPDDVRRCAHRGAGHRVTDRTPSAGRRPASPACRRRTPARRGTRRRPACAPPGRWPRTPGRRSTG